MRFARLAVSKRRVDKNFRADKEFVAAYEQSLVAVRDDRTQRAKARLSSMR